MYSKRNFKENQLTKNFSNVEGFSNVNGYIDFNYFQNNLLRNISWNYDNIFKGKSRDDIRKHVSIVDDSELDNLRTKGMIDNINHHTGATGDGSGMWSKKDNKAYHYFDDLYKKLACCTGQRNVNIPYSKISGNNVRTDSTDINIDVDGGECKIGGVDWFDDNSTPNKTNQNCEKFLTRLIAYLEQNDPNSPLVKKYGGCLATKYVNAALKKSSAGKPISASKKTLYNKMRKIFVPECGTGPTTFRRKIDREANSISICEASMEVGNMKASGDSSQIQLAQKIEQNCDINEAQVGDETKTSEGNNKSTPTPQTPTPQTSQTPAVEKTTTQTPTGTSTTTPAGTTTTEPDGTTPVAAATAGELPATTTGEELDDVKNLDFFGFIGVFFKYLFHKDGKDAAKDARMETFKRQLKDNKDYKLYRTMFFAIPSGIILLFFMMMMMGGRRPAPVPNAF